MTPGAHGEWPGAGTARASLVAELLPATRGYPRGAGQKSLPSRPPRGPHKSCGHSKWSRKKLVSGVVHKAMMFLVTCGGLVSNVFMLVAVALQYCTCAIEQCERGCRPERDKRGALKRLKVVALSSSAGRGTTVFSVSPSGAAALPDRRLGEESRCTLATDTKTTRPTAKALVHARQVITPLRILVDRALSRRLTSRPVRGFGNPHKTGNPQANLLPKEHRNQREL